MEWVSQHWWQVALVALGIALLVEVKRARDDLREIFKAIWTLPGMRERVEHQRWLRSEWSDDATRRSEKR